MLVVVCKGRTIWKERLLSLFLLDFWLESNVLSTFACRRRRRDGSTIPKVIDSDSGVSVAGGRRVDTLTEAEEEEVKASVVVITIASTERTAHCVTVPSASFICEHQQTDTLNSQLSTLNSQLVFYFQSLADVILSESLA